jgi:hypothetical protein
MIYLKLLIRLVLTNVNALQLREPTTWTIGRFAGGVKRLDNPLSAQ